MWQDLRQEGPCVSYGRYAPLMEDDGSLNEEGSMMEDVEEQHDKNQELAIQWVGELMEEEERPSDDREQLPPSDGDASDDGELSA